MTWTLALSAVANADQEIVLVSRYNGGSYEETATYSFRCMTHDKNLAFNYWDILFEGDFRFNYGSGQDTFRVNTTSESDSYIYDLGPGNCGQIDASAINRVVIRRLTRERSDNIPVIQGHCYLVDGQTGAGSAVALFQVKHHIPGAVAILSQVNVLSRSSTGRHGSCK